MTHGHQRNDRVKVEPVAIFYVYHANRRRNYYWPSDITY